jgi:YfiH family protein
VAEGLEDGVVAAFSTRNGGVSLPPFNTLNVSINEGDSSQSVRTNIGVITRGLGLVPDRVAFMRQVHGDGVAAVDSVPESAPEADALIADRPGVFVAVKTADCLPLLLLDLRRRVAAAVHVGRRGALLRIAGKTAGLMCSRHGCDPGDIIALIGPAIGPCCYEVDEPVLGPLRAALPHCDAYVRRVEVHESANGNATRRESLRLDLPGLAKAELIAAGVSPDAIHDTGLCSACRPDLFFSYRRDGAKTGRQLAAAGFLE